jgi:hypothetical protein
MNNRIKLSINCRRISLLDDDIVSIHQSLLDCVASFPPPWKLDFNGTPIIKPGQLSAICKASRKGKFSGHVRYTFRGEHYLKDESQYDDYIGLRFRANEEELELMAQEVLPKLVNTFGAYRAEVMVDDLACQDWLAISKVTREADCDVFGRYGVYRVWPLAYYSNSLLKNIPKLINGAPLGNGYMFNAVKEYFNNQYEQFNDKVTK